MVGKVPLSLHPTVLGWSRCSEVCWLNGSFKWEDHTPRTVIPQYLWGAGSSICCRYQYPWMLKPHRWPSIPLVLHPGIQPAMDHVIWWFVFFFFFLVLPLYCYQPISLHPHAHMLSCNPMDYSLPGSSVHGLFQARILEWIAISFSMVVCLYWKGYTTCTVQIHVVQGSTVYILNSLKKYLLNISACQAMFQMLQIGNTKFLVSECYRCYSAH